MKKSNSRTVESVAAETGGITIGAEVTVMDGALIKIEGNCTSGDGRVISFSVYRDGNSFGRNQNGSESLMIEAGATLEAYIAAVKAEYTESSTTEGEE